MKLVRITDDNINLIDDFLNIAGRSLEKFRYFSRRQKSVISNHLVTYMMLDDNVPVCYGHLDYEAETGITWLGIAVSEGRTGKGIGTSMMEELVAFARHNNLEEIYLTVDNDNLSAIILYEKFSFIKDEVTRTYSRYHLILSY